MFLFTKNFLRALAALLLLTFNLQADDTPNHVVSYTDGFDVSQGTIVTFNTPVYDSFDIRDLFGSKKLDAIEPGHVIFADRPTPANNTDIVVFRTGKHIRLNGYRLVSATAPVGVRPLDKFALYAAPEEAGPYTLVDQFTIDQSQVDTSSYQGAAISDTNRYFAPRVEKYFRAEFVRPVTSIGIIIDTNSNANNLSGPRIHELDAITIPNADLPVTTLTLPGGVDYVEGNEIILEATASDSDGIRGVNFYSDGQLLGFITNSGTNYVFHWTNAPFGSHAIQAKGVDILDDEGGSPIVQIQVQPIAVKLSAPSVAADSSFQFNLGPLVIGRTYNVLNSTNLSSWDPLESFTADSTNRVVRDLGTQGIPWRFYKIEFH